MKIKIDDKELELHYSMRIYINYEAILNKSVDFQDLGNYTNLLTLFFSTVMSTLKYNKMEHVFTYDDFINWVDDNGGANLMNEFALWFAGKLAEERQMTQDIQRNNESGEVEKNS